MPFGLIRQTAGVLLWRTLTSSRRDNTTPGTAAPRPRPPHRPPARRLKEQDGFRRSSSRNKPSPAFEKAINWLKKENIEKITRRRGQEGQEERTGNENTL